MSIVGLADRYIEAPGPSLDVICIRDRATGRRIIAQCDDRRGCLDLIRLLNVADSIVDRVTA